MHELEEDNDLAALQEEAEMDIEELRKRYCSAPSFNNEEGEESTATTIATSNNETNDEGENPTEISDDCLIAFMNSASGEVEGYDSNDDTDFIYNAYKPPRVGPEYQVCNYFII